MGSANRLSPDRAPGRRWARAVAQELESPVVAVAMRVAVELGVRPGQLAAVADLDSSDAQQRADDMAQLDDLSAPVGGWGDPWLVGEVHEYAVSSRERRRRGAWYTPRDVARELVGLTLDAADGTVFVVDPCCGGGGFLLAAAEHLVDSRSDAVLRSKATETLAHLAGSDIDPGAVEATRWALILWAVANGATLDDARCLVEEQITVADSLHEPLPDWPDQRLVIGNPPFASPLKSGAIGPAADEYRRQHVDDLGPYADQAFFHLHRAITSSGPGSVVTLVQPQSLLAGRDAAPLRQVLDNRASLHTLWVSRRAVFDAGARVCAPILVVGGETMNNIRLVADGRYETVANSAVPDAGAEHLGADSPSWAALGARALGAPDLPRTLWRPAKDLSSMATATAGFRDEYYGLARAAREGTGAVNDASKRLLTVGSIEPLVTVWGYQPVRLAGQRFLCPTVDMDELDGKVRRWADGQLQPKVILATQSKVLEPVVDPDGELLPLTPLISVFSEPSDLYLVTAVLLSPPVVVWAWRRNFGTALSVEAVKLAARDVLTLPLPTNRAVWDKAATILLDTQHERCDGDVAAAWATAERVGHLMTEAYGGDSALTRWWLDRAKQSWVGAAPQG